MKIRLFVTKEGFNILARVGYDAMGFDVTAINPLFSQSHPEHNIEVVLDSREYSIEALTDFSFSITSN